MRLLLGDCLDKLKELDDNSIDSIVTDPPYGLSFMGKDWDKVKATQETKSQVVKGLGAGMKMTTLADNIEFEKWVTEWSMECMRVLKPGGYMLAFGGSRMYHRLASGVENAGFEIRDQIMWIYGSGFPKSMNIGMKVDEKLGNERELVERPKSEQRPNADKNRDNNKDIGGFAMSDNKYKSVGNSEWEGWGTALKPAHEPIVMARKPFKGTVVDNVLEWGTGGINIDDSRIGLDEELDKSQLRTINRSEKTGNDGWGMNSKGSDVAQVVRPEGRFPANVIFDEEAGKILDEQSGVSKSSGGRAYQNTNDMYSGGWSSKDEGLKQDPGFGDVGGASRFFYCPKTSKTDRNEGLSEFEDKNGVKQFTDKGGLKCKKCNKWKNSGNPCQCDEPDFEQQQWNGTVDKNSHPTVKPTDLMLYLIRMVTPKGGTTLDPFMGSGSTGKAAVRGGFEFVGIEREKEYMEIAKARIQYEQDNPYKEETGERIEVNKNSTKFW